MLDSIRLRLALWHLVILALLQIGLCCGVYLFLFDHLIRQSDRVLLTVLQSVEAELHKASAAHLGAPLDPVQATLILNAVVHNETPLVIRNQAGEVLAERPSHAASLTPVPDSLPAGADFLYQTMEAAPSGEPGPRRIGIAIVHSNDAAQTYVIAASQSLEARLAELHTARLAFLITVPILLALTGFGGWMLTGRTFAPATAMSDRARQIDAENLNERIHVENPRDELGTIAQSFNQLLDRVSAAAMRERQFMADAAHQLRTPISVIQTATGVILSSEQRSAEEYRSVLDIIATYARRLSRDVDDVFRLARADAGFKSILMQNLYLNEVVLDAVRAARVLAQQKNIEIVASAIEDSPYHGDEALLGEMILNLLDNAIKYTPEGGAIHLELKRSDPHYTVEITDNGVGIAPIHQPRIFDRFYRAAPEAPASPDETVNAAGSGLGLPIALWIARSHNGSLELLSSNPTGTTFRITL